MHEYDRDFDDLWELNVNLDICTVSVEIIILSLIF